MARGGEATGIKLTLPISPCPKAQPGWFSEAKGYGFIACPEGGGDIADVSSAFVHFSEIEGEGYRTLSDGDRVRFDIERGPRGRYATKVRGPRRRPAQPPPSDRRQPVKR